MDKQKQVEEMAKVMAKTIVDELKIDKYWAIIIADMLIKKGYRKILEGAVVLTREEYQRYERIEKIIKLAKLEKAIGYEVKNGKLYYFSNMLGGCEIEFKDLQEICDTANHYNEEFFGLQQRLDFWKGKAEETRKETAEKFAERLKERLAESCNKVFEQRIEPMMGYEIDDCEDTIDEICKEITEGKL